MTPTEIWLFIFQALTTLVALGGFLFLFFKDKNKQQQLDKLTAISETWSKLYEMERKKLRLSYLPELRLLESFVAVDRDSVYRISNIGQSAIVERITIEPEGAAFLENANYPFNIDKEGYVKIKFKVTQLTHLDDIKCHIFFKDKSDNMYKVTINKNQLGQPIERFGINE